jgi:putative transposase
LARAKRHCVSGQIWHIPQRFHKQEFLLKFKQDRHPWIQWLLEAKKRFGLVVLNYGVTSNYIHLTVKDDNDHNRSSHRWLGLSPEKLPRNITGGHHKFIDREHKEKINGW